MSKYAVKCDCGKLVAHIRDGKIYVWCKHCKKEVEIPIDRRPKQNRITNH